MAKDNTERAQQAAIITAQVVNQRVKLVALTDLKANQYRPALAFTSQLTQAFAEASRQAQAENARLGISPLIKKRNLKHRKVTQSRVPNKAEIG